MPGLNRRIGRSAILGGIATPRALLRRFLLVAALGGAAGWSSPRASAGPPDKYEQALSTYQTWVKRPSFDKRTAGRVRFASTQDARARDVLIASYERPEEPTDHVAYSIVSIVTKHFDRAEDVPALGRWRAARTRPEDAWLWFRTWAADRSADGEAAALSAAAAPGDPCLRAASLARLGSGDDPAALAVISRILSSIGPDPFERAVLLEACAEALLERSGLLGKEEFHDPAMRVIRAIDDPLTPQRTRLVVGRALARLFDKPYPVLESKYWNRLLLIAESENAEAAPDDRYAPPKQPTFGGVPATGKRIVYLIDASDSMLAPLSVKELTQIQKPRGPVTPGDDAGKLPPPPAEPPPEEKPRDPIAGEDVDWKKVRNRFDGARAMLESSLKGLAEDMSFAVIVFGTKAELLKSTQGMTAASPANVRRTVAELDAMKPGKPTGTRPYGTLLGHTNMHGALRRAFKLKEQGLHGNFEYVAPKAFFEGCDTIFVLSDGDPSYSDWPMADRRDPEDHAGDPETGKPHANTENLVYHGPYSHDSWILDDLRRLNLLRRVEIHCVGLGEANGWLLAEVAKLGHGRVRTIAPDEPEKKDK